MHIGKYLAGILLITATTAAGQSTAPYLLLKTTYGFTANPQKINETAVLIRDREYTKGVYGSYGRGFCLQLGLGKMINSTFGFELDAELLLGRKVKAAFNSSEDSITGLTTDKVRGLIFKPVVVIRNSGDLLSIYTKLGLAISTATNRYEESELSIVFPGLSQQVIYESKETARAKVGFTACFGLAFRVSESISVLTEINGQMLSLPVTRGHYTKYLENGQNKLPTLQVRDRSWIYEKAGFFNEESDPNKPDKRLYSPANFSYVGVGVGITYHF